MNEREPTGSQACLTVKTVEYLARHRWADTKISCALFITTE